jgi:cell wall-associated NlpC family hydrolase
VHELRSRRRGLLPNVGMSIALGACLCAGTLVGTNATTGAAPAAPVTSGTATLDASSIELVAASSSRAARRARVIAQAKRLVGKPYRYGASGPRAFDCSGFTRYVYRRAIGAKLPHKAHLQQRWGRPVARSKAQPGDLIVFRRGSYGYHAAIYAGNGYMYDAPGRGRKVGKHKIWSRTYVVRRLV